MDGGGDGEGEEDVTALLLAPADDVLPLGFSGFFGVFGEGLPGGEEDGGGVCGPGEGVGVERLAEEREGFAAGEGKEPDAGGFVGFVGSVGWRWGERAVGEEGEEAAVGGEERGGVVAGVGGG